MFSQSAARPSTQAMCSSRSGRGRSAGQARAALAGQLTVVIAVVRLKRQVIQKNPLRRKGAEKVQSLRRGQLIKVAKSCRHRLRVEAGKVCRVCTAEGGVSRHEKALAAHADQVGLMGILPVARAVVTGIPGQDICPAHADGAQIGANGRTSAPPRRRRGP